MYQLKVDVYMLNAVKSVLADVSSVSPSSLCSDEGLTLETSANTLFTAFSISTSTLNTERSVQNAAAGFVTNRYSSESDVLNLGWLPVKERTVCIARARERLL